MIRYFLKLKSWELFLMLALPLALTYLMQFKYTVNLIGSLVLFVLIYLPTLRPDSRLQPPSWMFPLGI